MSTVRRESARAIKDPAGGYLCSCGCGQKPVKPRRNWFSQECVDKWLLANHSGHVRGLVLQRDKGVCACCGRNVEALQKQYRQALWKLNERPSWYADHMLEFHHPRKPNAQKIARLVAWRNREGYPEIGRTWWEADHILEVVRGGGQCGLENYQTLCVPCHKIKTARLARERAEERAAAQLAEVKARDPQLQLL